MHRTYDVLLELSLVTRADNTRQDDSPDLTPAEHNMPDTVLCTDRTIIKD